MHGMTAYTYMSNIANTITNFEQTKLNDHCIRLFNIKKQKTNIKKKLKIKKEITSYGLGLKVLLRIIL